MGLGKGSLKSPERTKEATWRTYYTPGTTIYRNTTGEETERREDEWGVLDDVRRQRAARGFRLEYQFYKEKGEQRTSSNRTEITG